MDRGYQTPELRYGEACVSTRPCLHLTWRESRLPFHERPPKATAVPTIGSQIPPATPVANSLTAVLSKYPIPAEITNAMPIFQLGSIRYLPNRHHAV